MNLGFYMEDTGGSPNNLEIFNALNDSLESQELNDACVFYNNVDFNPVSPKFGMFNSTDIWYFTGQLIATSLNNVVKASTCVNKFKLAYLYNPDEKDLFGLLRASDVVPTIAKNQEDAKEYFRLTNVKPKVMDGLSIKNILRILS